MIKMYKVSNHSGSSAEFWDDNWESESNSYYDPVCMCENTRLWSLIESKIQRERLFLEGGCGPGHWVRYYHDRGFKVLGIDFAHRTIEKLRRINPALDVRVANICRIPAEDGQVHVYYSGGVMEHFESGPEPALREAKRVLARDGWFLCSVPDANWLRRGLLYRNAGFDKAVYNGELAIRQVKRTQIEPLCENRPFFQYAFREDEFRTYLDQAGFQVMETFGYDLIWGLFEIPGFKPTYEIFHRLARSMFYRSSGSQVKDADVTQSDRTPAKWIPFLLKRALIREDPSLPILGSLVRTLSNCMANMRMYVARPR